jgi:Co/Zn/Cd efflux system component
MRVNPLGDDNEPIEADWIRPKRTVETRNAELIHIPIATLLPPKRGRTTEGADTVVRYALLLNGADTICKFTAAYITGSKSLFAEAVHSLMDTVNQIILFFGKRSS